MAPRARQVDGGKLEATSTIGFHGYCPSGDIVRVGGPEGVTRGPTLITVDRCPACGSRHTRIKPSLRKPIAYDKGREVEVVVDEEGQQVRSEVDGR